MDLECPQCILIMCGYKNDQRKLLDGQRLDYAKAVELWHLHIEKNQIGALTLNRGDGGQAIATLAGDLEFVAGLQEPANAATSQRLIIHNQHLILPHASIARFRLL